MDEAPKLFESMQGLRINSVGSDYALLDFQGERFLLSYDVMYEMAIQLAHLIQRADEAPPARTALQ